MNGAGLTAKSSGNNGAALTGRAFFRINEVAQILCISESAVYRLIASRRLGSIKIAGPDSAIRVPAQDLQRYVERQRNAPVWEGDA